VGVYLSGDKTELYTDYEFNVTSTVAQRQSRMNRSPGPAPIIIRQWGGETNIGGIVVKIIDQNVPLLPDDKPLLLLLTLDASSGKFVVFDGGAGAFLIGSDAKVQHLLVPEVGAYQRFNGMLLSEVVAEVHRNGR
jgi:hypothetical protein